MAGRSGGGSTAQGRVREPLPAPSQAADGVCFAHLILLQLPPPHCWGNSFAWGLPATVTGKWQQGFGTCHPLQPGPPVSSLSALTCRPLVLQLLITGALFPPYWAFPGLPFCVSLSIVSVMETSLFGSQLWLLCRSGSLIFGTATE